MRRLDKNRVVRFRYRYHGIPAGSIARVVQFSSPQGSYGLQLPSGFSGHSLGSCLKTPTGWYVPRDVLEPTRVKVSGAREFNKRYKFSPAVEESCAAKA